MENEHDDGESYERIAELPVDEPAMWASLLILCGFATLIYSAPFDMLASQAKGLLSRSCVPSTRTMKAVRVSALSLGCTRGPWPR